MRRSGATTSPAKACRVWSGSRSGIGLGHIGRRLVELLRPFGCPVVAYDPYVPKEVALALHVEMAPLEHVLSASDAGDRPSSRLGSGAGVTPFKIGRIAQVAFVVRDLEAKMSTFWNDFGIGPWSIYALEPPRIMTLIELIQLPQERYSPDATYP